MESPKLDVDLQDYDGPIYVHAPYLINVQYLNNKVRHSSRKLLKDTYASFGAKGVNSRRISVEKVEITGVGYRKAIEHVKIQA